MNKKVKWIISTAVLTVVSVLAGHYLLKPIFKKNTLGYEVIDMTKPWVPNNLHGLYFETPEPLKKENMDKATSYDSMINNLDVYLFKRDHFVTMFINMDTKFSNYDTEKGLYASIQNAVNLMGGKKLNLKFTTAEGKLNHRLAEGEYRFKGNPVLVKGYCFWNANGKVLILITLIGKSDDNEKVIQKIIDSRKLQDTLL